MKISGMKVKMKWNESIKVTRLIFMGIFLLLLLCNILTPMIADDFSYSFSCATSERIKSIGDIFESLRAHAYYINGRLNAHFFAYLFLLLPSWIFDILNSFMFALQVALIYKISKCDSDKNNNLLLMGIFGLLWMFVPVFGQVYLWLDGSCNYLWAIVFGLVFIVPYVNEFYHDKSIKSSILKGLYIIFAFFAGGYLENSSAAFIFMAVVFLGLCKFYQHKKIKIYLLLSVITASLGYISIYLSPAQWNNKSAGFSLVAIRERFISALGVYKTLTVPLVLFVVLLVLAVTLKVENKRILIAIIFVCGSLAANFIMILARSYPERCASSPTAMLIIADGILFYDVMRKQYKTLGACAVATLMLLTSYEVLVGVNDIYESYGYIKTNEEYIYECKEEGIMDIELQWYNAETKYSGMYGIWYLSPEPGTDQWPNCDLAKYYGIDSIIAR